MEMRIVIVGAGDTGLDLALRLSVGHQVLLLERNLASLKWDGPVLQPEDPEAQDEAPGVGLRMVQGDGTSRLVLEKLYSEPMNTALVAVAGSDEVNVELARLAVPIGYDPVVAVQHSAAAAEQYRDVKVTALERTQLMADEIQRSLRHHGAIIPRGVGLGRGELQEIRLVRTSPIIGRPLSTLAPHKWRVAAVFRGDELIVPLGTTTLQEDDRVLVVGEPAVLSVVTEYLRLGTPQFPQPFGPNIATLEPGGPDEAMGRVALALAEQAGAPLVARGTTEDAVEPEDFGDLEQEEAHAPDRDPKGAPEVMTVQVPPLHEARFAQTVLRNRPGLVIVRPGARTAMDRFFGRRGLDAELCDTLGRPVLFFRERWPWRRILLPVSYSPLNLRAAEVALDISRQLGSSITAMNVDLPRYISGLEEDVVHEEVVPIRRLCELHEVALDYRHAWGNPVKHLTAEAEQHDLVVVIRRAERRDTWFDPDVAMRIARGAPCSVLVLTQRQTA